MERKLELIMKCALALGIFIFVLSILFNIGFNRKLRNFSISELQKRLRLTKSASQMSEPVFYKSVGRFEPSRLASKEENKGKGELNDQFTIELKVVSSKNQAEKLIHSLTKNGVDAFYTPYQNNGRVIFKVRHGVFSNKASAEKKVSTLRISENFSPTIVQLQ